MKNGRLSTDLYFKPVDRHQYLHYSSCHAEHIKKSIIYSQTLRLKRICSQIKDLESHVKDLKGQFLRRGYPQRIVKEQIDRAFRLPLKHNTQQYKVQSGIPLVLPYNPVFRNLSTTLRKNFNILYSDAEVRTVFTQSPFVTYRSARNLTSFLVRSKVYPLKRTVTSSKCASKRCQVCVYVSETNTFEPFQKKKNNIRLIITSIVMISV